MNKYLSKTYMDAFGLEVCMFILRECAKEETFTPFFFDEALKDRFSADGYLPEGCKNLDLLPHTIIEVKRRIFPDTIVRWVKSIQAAFINPNDEYRFVLIHKSQNIKPDWKLNIEGINISIISFDDLKNRGSKSLESVNDDEEKNYDYINNINNRLESENNQELILDSLKAEANKKNLTFFLGAGVSVSGGLPSWDKLLKNLVHEINTKHKPSILSSQNIGKLKDVANNSAIIMARYMRVGKDQPRMKLRPNTTNLFNEALHRALYSGSISYNKKALMKSIERLIIDKKVKAVITYNFDDYLEDSLKKINFPYQTVADGGRLMAGNFPIYHVHGLLPIDKNDPNIPNPVLTEETYHRLYQDAYQWSNVEQLHALNNTTCVFIGLSMTDPNLRRLMEISMMKNESDNIIAPHYVFLRKTKFFEDKNNHTNDSTEIEDEENRLIIEKILHELGANIIWYDKHDDLPDLLNQL